MYSHELRSVMPLIILYYIVGESDGLYNGKRFFKCPPKHGLFVPINEAAYVSESPFKASI